jgi:hypothetical protein
MKRKVLAIRLSAFILAVIIGLASGYQIFGDSRDIGNYFIFFDEVRYAPSILSLQTRFEPGFSALVYSLIKVTNLDNQLIYALIVSFFVFIKYASIDYTKKYWTVFFVFTFYFVVRYVPLFEMTVLRASCALSIVFYVFMRKNDGELRIKEIIILFCAILFHYSAAIFLFIYFIKPTSRKKIIFVSVIAFLVIIFFKKIVLQILPNYIPVFNTYDSFNNATLVPIPYMLDIVFLIFMLVYFDAADLVMRYAILGVTIGVAFHFSLLEYSIFASRFRELLSIFLLIYAVRAMSCSDKKVKYGVILYVFFSGFLIYDPLFI